MKNKIIDAFKVADRLVSITVENPDLSKLRVNQFVKIGGKSIEFIVFRFSIQIHLSQS